MKYNPDRHHRRSIRLDGYDYTWNGAYFVTVCAQNRECLFGEIVSGKMILNDVGQMVEKWWLKLSCKFPKIRTDEYVIMPNHLHGIILIVGADPCVRPEAGAYADSDKGAHTGAPLPTMIQWLKTMTTNEYIRNVRQYRWRPLPGRLWQRGYYEHIIRDRNKLYDIRKYTVNNPAQWELDEENPHQAKHKLP